MNAIGWDSIATLNLTINNSTASVTDTVCDSYDWNGIYDSTGVYTFLLLTLDVIVQQP